MPDNPWWEICERVAELLALLDDHIACGKHSTADVVAKAQGLLSEPETAANVDPCRLFPAERASTGVSGARDDASPKALRSLISRVCKRRWSIKMTTVARRGRFAEAMEGRRLRANVSGT
jgi:hypothetical protein